MNLKYGILIIITLHLIQRHAFGISGSELSTTEHVSEDILDTQTLEPCNVSTTFTQSLPNSDDKDTHGALLENTTKMTINETANLGPCFTAAGRVSTSNAIGAHGNVDIRELREILHCVDYSLCSYNKQFKVPVCYCDSLCVLYDDCCIDYHTSNSSSYELTPEQTSKNPQPSSESSDRYKETKTFKSFYSCSVWCYGRQYFGYQFVSSCPDGTNADLVDLCANKDMDVPMTMIPVLGANGIHFRNRFCAQCHNISLVTYWQLIVEDLIVSDFELTKEKLFTVFFTSACRSIVIPPSNNEHVRYCTRTIDKLQYGEAENTFHYDNKTYLDNELCRRFRFPIWGRLQQKNTDKTSISSNRVAFYRNSACVSSEGFHQCIKGSDLSTTEIVYRHLYDKYSLSFLFQFDHLLPQQGPVLCEKNKRMLTFLVRDHPFKLKGWGVV